jgi:lantibiotic transport system ATP-binding protein
MGMFCIETENLDYRFSKEQQVLDSINLQVPTGSIYGFLGPNGAGKTTTLRLVLGLLEKQSGEIRIFNKYFSANRIAILRQLGSLIESPSLYSHLTAAENLKIQQLIYQCPPTRIGEVLETVGLAHTGNKKAGQFSLGMKQRLSIAVALLHDPPLLILDEPTNGLDPNGIIEIRELLIRLNRDQQKTILISSHLLGEIEKMVTHVGIIHKGQLLFQGSIHALHNKQEQSAAIHLETSNDALATNWLLENGLSSRYENGQIIIPKQDKPAIAAINKCLVEQGIDIYQITTIRNDLESIFINLVK